MQSETTPEGTRSFNSSWKLNGVSVIGKDIKKVVDEFNIQFENLCQFLPQDKVRRGCM